MSSGQIVHLLRHHYVFWSLLLCLLFVQTGCSRKHYREGADNEVYSLLNTVDEADPLWKMDGFTLDQNANSRYSSFYDQDKQPMPPDDPTSHRLMENVDGMKGSKKWNENGRTNIVENEAWKNSLPAPVDGKIILDQKAAFDLALIHSPDYRSALENLYMSALSVTGERYAFDVQFFGGESLFYRNNGGFRSDSTSTLTNNLNLEMKKKFATGGELIAGLANSMVWTFTPSTGFTPTTTLSYSFTQPFLRGAGRAIVLESLTQSERYLLANVRQLIFYQQGFYVKVLTGGSPVGSPSSGSYPNTGVSPTSLSGFYGLLAEQVQIRNQEQTVVSLQDNLNRYEELFKAGFVASRSEVDRVRQDLLSAQSTLLSRNNNYQDSIDSYLIALGLPPGIKNIVVKDPLLEQFQLMSISLENVQGSLDKFLSLLRNMSLENPNNYKEFLAELKQGVQEGEQQTLDDINRLEQEVLPGRLKSYEILLKKIKASGSNMNTSFFEPASLKKKIDVIRGDYDRKQAVPGDYGGDRAKGVQWILSDIFMLLDETILKYDRSTLVKMIEETRKNPAESPFSPQVITLVTNLQLESALLDEEEEKNDKENIQDELTSSTFKTKTPVMKDDPWRKWLHDCLTLLGDEIMTLRLVQARARLESLDLSVVNIDSDDAFRVAEEHRFDWMNARSNLVDQWRNIEIVANHLKGVLDVEVGGSITNEGNNMLNFSRKNASFTTGLSFDAPLSRLLERNEYRRALISYDRARRSYYNYVDNVHLQVRSMIRSIELAQMDFELTRDSVLTAIQRVHQSQLALTKPPSGASKIGTISSNAAMDLVDSLTALLSAQNSIMQTWLQYKSKKMNLLLILGIFDIDREGRWVDPGDIDEKFLSGINTQVGNTRQDELTGLNSLRPVESLTGGVPLESIVTAEEIAQEGFASSNSSFIQDSSPVIHSNSGTNSPALRSGSTNWNSAYPTSSTNNTSNNGSVTSQKIRSIRPETSDNASSGRAGSAQTYKKTVTNNKYIPDTARTSDIVRSSSNSIDSESMARTSKLGITNKL